jgi:hypothetical protein
MSFFEAKKNKHIFASVIGGMAEWSNAAVLKTVEGHTSGGSNPSSSAFKFNPLFSQWVFFLKTLDIIR